MTRLWRNSVDATDLKSVGLYARVGSIPTSRTKKGVKMKKEDDPTDVMTLEILEAVKKFVLKQVKLENVKKFQVFDMSKTHGVIRSKFKSRYLMLIYSPCYADKIDDWGCGLESNEFVNELHELFTCAPHNDYCENKRQDADEYQPGTDGCGVCKTNIGNVVEIVTYMYMEEEYLDDVNELKTAISLIKDTKIVSAVIKIMANIKGRKAKEDALLSVINSFKELAK